MSESIKIYTKEKPKIEKIEVLPPPPPHIIKPKDAITVLVMEDLKSRADRGVQKYNTTLHENNHDNFTQHLYEELLDAAQYCKKQLLIKDTVQDLVKQYSNDADLGNIIRKIYG